MCGIAGIVWRDPRRPATAGDVDAMTRVLVHRGPDDGDRFLDGSVGLGHRRLSIVGLGPDGRQPMPSADGRFVVVFNGEIYNHVELREELAATGVRFRTRTDTEVLLEAYRRWGSDCVHRFNGMWAFALLDTRERTLLLSRDRLGIKPLYLGDDGDGLVFASEIKAILAVRPEAREPNVPYVTRFLRSGIRDHGTETAFRRVRSLPAGHNLLVDIESGARAESAFWQIDESRLGTIAADDDAHERLAELVESSIRLRLRSDVPVGTCLSGGIDSSTIVGLASRQRSQPIHTFSALYDDRACDERRYVDLVNAHTNTEPVPVWPDCSSGLVDELRRMTWHQDEPTASPGLLTQYRVMQAAARDVKVVLDGQGGDELFAGYLYDLVPHLRDRLRRRPLLGRLTGAGDLLGILRHWGAATGAEYLNTLLGGGLSWIKPFVRRPRSRGIDVVAADFAAEAEATSPKSLPKSFGRNGTELIRSLHAQVTRTSLPTLLHYEDRNSMAFSIEARVPLLDHRIVEFAFAVRDEARIRGTWTKHGLRRIAETVVPREVAWRRSKMGYPTPIGRWLRSPENRADLDAILLDDTASDDPLDTETVTRLWREHTAGIDHGWLLYRVLTTRLWWREIAAVAASPRVAAA